MQPDNPQSMDDDRKLVVCGNARPTPLSFQVSGFRPHPSAFTLIELLVVIAIIGILAALLLPAVKSMMTESARSKAATQVVAVANAIRAYRTEYGRWPGQTIASADGSLGNTAPTQAAILGGLTNNPRGKVFLDIKQSWLSTNGNPVVLWDHWQRPLLIAMDEDANNVVGPITWTGAGSLGPTSVVNQTVLVMSWGPEPVKRPEKRVFSWQR